MAAAGLLALSPLLLVVILAVRGTSPGPAFFFQTRVGRGGRPFRLAKFRSMRVHSPGKKFTASGDSRITPVGAFLRKTKIDELPQLWNVLLGQMSFVGPRPEVPDYVDPSNPLWQKVLEARPGLTHPLTLILHPEEELLAQVEGDSKEFYDRFFLPYKLYGYIGYLQQRNAWTDLRMIFQTFFEIARPHRDRQPSPREIEESVRSLGLDAQS